eukprot:CAMPEP_0113615586 /NCGR_PEP_ID=MMETSP0017_2-20120614/7782_1 /TAXON_ID=2856 /ORGANISM="Cylindrotheca closterium" /LENGTH=484 /DNA_ID=CAMNT_0000524837 /DNA_START=49 /DNA_END=1503 /DNA_ORIENTATION=+ /assembly_acc=CAM_ASM_000147
MPFHTEAGTVATMDSTATPPRPTVNPHGQAYNSPDQLYSQSPSPSSPDNNNASSPRQSSTDEEEPSYHSHSQRPLLRSNTNNSSSSKKAERSSSVLMKKSTLFFLGFVLLAFVVAFGYFFSEWLFQRQNMASGNNRDKANCFLEDEIECPFTQDDVDDLSSEIDRLEELNKQLVNQMDDYEDLTNRLNQSVAELKRQNDILSDSNDKYEDLNDQLSDTVEELKQQNQFLKEQVDTFADLNQDLNSTVIDLKEEVDRLEGQVTNFTKENDRLEDLVSSLSNETDTLTDLSNVLQENVDRLKGEVGSLKTENGRLESSIEDLKTVIGFWDDVMGNVDNTYEEMTAFLAQQITTNRNLVLEALENTYHQRVADWDCGLRAQYALEPFAQDDSITIPSDKYNSVIDFVDGRVLSDLCLSRSNFESYLTGRYPSGGISVDRLVTSVRRYTWDAIDHYFPEKGEEGLTKENWAMANFTCNKLMPSQKYSV